MTGKQTLAMLLTMAVGLGCSSALAQALPIKALPPKAVDANPYMAAGDTNIHHDCYNTDSTDEVLPIGIYPEINVSYEKTNANASPAVFFDAYGHAVVPLLGGIAISTRMRRRPSARFPQRSRMAAAM